MSASQFDNVLSPMGRLPAATSKLCSSSSLLSYKKKKKYEAKTADKPVKPVKRKLSE